MRFQIICVLTPIAFSTAVAAGARGKDLMSLFKEGARLAKIGKTITKGAGGPDGGSPPTPTPNSATPTSYTTPTASVTECASTDTACVSCAWAAVTVAACSSAIPNFDSISNQQLAQCVCYNPAPSNDSSFVWVPNQFDVPFSACPVWANTAEPNEASALASVTDFCNDMGNVLNATSTDLASFVAATISSPAAVSSQLASGTAVTGAQTSVPASASGPAAQPLDSKLLLATVTVAFACFVAMLTL